MRDGRSHTVLGGVSSSFTSGSYSSEVLMKMLEVTKIVNDVIFTHPNPTVWSEPP
jgi:hypothetical protein